MRSGDLVVRLGLASTSARTEVATLTPVFYPLGYPVHFETASAPVVEAAARSWAHWLPLFQSQPLRIHIQVSDSGSLSRAPKFRATGSGFEFFADPSNYAVFDYGRRQGRLRVSRTTLREASWFRYHFLDALTLTALDSIVFTPIHAACVARRGRGILLCGDSGAGKSSLAYACSRRGWTFVSDDAVHIVSGSSGIIVGNPHRLHLREAALALFPDIPQAASVIQPNGKYAIGLPMAGEPIAFASGCVFLSRNSQKCLLTPASRERGRAYFRKYITWGDERTREEDFGGILEPGCWELEYDRFDDVIATLEDLLA